MQSPRYGRVYDGIDAKNDFLLFQNLTPLFCVPFCSNQSDVFGISQPKSDISMIFKSICNASGQKLVGRKEICLNSWKKDVEKKIKIGVKIRTKVRKLGLK